MPDTDLVFVGDVCDRGYNSKDIYELIMAWQEEAPRQGSRVWFLLGNHEVMNAYGLRHYNTAEEYLSYDPASVAAGKRAHSEAFAAGGWLRGWLARQRAMIRIDSFVFAHGDLPTALSGWSIDEIDGRVMELFRSSTPLSPGDSLPDALFAPDRSILWCRQAQLERPRGYRAALELFLARNGAGAYICGHTPAEEGAFRIGYGNRYLCIDTAMTFARQDIGRTSALVIENGSAVAAYFEAGDVVFRTLSLSFLPPPR